MNTLELGRTFGVSEAVVARALARVRDEDRAAKLRRMSEGEL